MTGGGGWASRPWKMPHEPGPVNEGCAESESPQGGAADGRDQPAPPTPAFRAITAASSLMAATGSGAPSG